MEERLLIEYRDLNKKIGILEKFIKKESFKEIEKEQQDLLMQQLEIMNRYSEILSIRLLLLMKTKKEK